MPLHVEIKLNSKTLHNFTIGRHDQLFDKEQVSTYEIIESTQEWGQGVKFQHRYSDGAVRCVEKGLAGWDVMNPYV